MKFVRALLACVHLMQLFAYGMLTACCNSCQRCVSAFISMLYAGFVKGLILPTRTVYKAAYVLVWKFAITICTVPWRLWNSLHTWYTASCCMLSRCLSLLEDIFCACLALLYQIYIQMKEAALQLLWSFLPWWIQTTCTCLAHFWYSTGKEDPASAPPRRASFAFGSFVISKIIRTALSRSTALLLDGSCACLALGCHIRSQLRKAALQLLWSFLPGWIQTMCAIIAYVWHNSGQQDPATLPPGTASFPIGNYIVTILVRRATYRPSRALRFSSGTEASPVVSSGISPVLTQHMHCDDSSSNVRKSSDDPQKASKVASEGKAKKHVDTEDGDNAHAAPTEVPDTRTSVVPEEVPDTMTNAAPGSCAGIVQGNSGAPMRVPGSGLRAASGKGKLVVGLFQYLEGAQQHEPAFDLFTPAREMVTPFVDVAECQELGNVEPGSLIPSNRLPIRRTRTRAQSQAALAAAMQVDFPYSHSSKGCRHNQNIKQMHKLAHQASRKAPMSFGR